MKLRLLVAVLVLLASLSKPLAAQPASSAKAKPISKSGTTLAEALEKTLTAHGQPKVKVGARVIDLATGQILYDLNGDAPMVPASNMKLIVLCAALDSFGKDYQFKTTLAQRGDDLVVIGGGDPTLGDDRLAQKQSKPVTAMLQNWAAKLKAAHITEIRGNLVIDDSMFDRQFTHPHWPPPQFQAWYEAPIGALNFGSNCVDVRVKPTKAGAPADVALVPPNTCLDISNRAVTGGKQTVSATRVREKDVILVSGSVAKDTKLGPISVRDPGLYFGYVFQSVLASQGIKVKGKVVRQSVRQSNGALPTGCKVIDTHCSPITWALARAGKQSLGMMAEALMKLLGTKSSAVGSWDTGKTAVADFLRKAHVPPSQYTLDDGSGLSRNNRLAPAASTAVLQYMYASQNSQFETLLEVLSHAGIDGTLEKRMKGPETRGRVFAKTGYIDGVRTLAGYVQTQDGKWLAFAFFYNQATSTRSLTQLQDKACALLAKWNGQ